MIDEEIMLHYAVIEMWQNGLTIGEISEKTGLEVSNIYWITYQYEAENPEEDHHDV